MPIVEHATTIMQVGVKDAGPVTCTFTDHLSNILWMGHSDGRVSAFSMGDAPGTAVNGQLLHCWQVCTHSPEPYIHITYSCHTIMISESPNGRQCSHQPSHSLAKPELDYFQLDVLIGMPEVLPPLQPGVAPTLP